METKDPIAKDVPPEVREAYRMAENRIRRAVVEAALDARSMSLVANALLNVAASIIAMMPEERRNAATADIASTFGRMVENERQRAQERLDSLGLGSMLRDRQSQPPVTPII